MKLSKRAFSARLPRIACAAFLGLVCPALMGCATAEQATVAQEASEAPSFPGELSRSLEGVYGGKSVAFTALLETTQIQNDVPGKGVDIVSFSYVAEGSGSERPVLFVFNGGPITASLWLHIGAVGPYRVALPDDVSAPASDASLVSNPYAPLDVADIVFFDPASTGYSRVHEGVDRTEYFTVQADAEQCADFIDAWLAKHERTGSPVFILGESYGTIRAAELAGQLAERGPEYALDGVFLMGQAVNIIEYAQRKENIISYVVSLPTLAATAWEFGKVSPNGQSFEAFMSEAKVFGETEYLAALFQGSRLDPETKTNIAAKLERFTGIPASYYVEHNLRISKETYRVELLKDDGLILGRSDARYTGPVSEGGDPSSVLQSTYENAFIDYVDAIFGFSPGDDYIRYAAPEEWIYGPPSPFSPFAFGARLDVAFEANPDFRLVIGNGYHDTMTTVGAAEYAAVQSNWPVDRVRTVFYPGGHMAYSVEASARAFGADIRDWITGSPVTTNGE
jgi:carboxypeptidase C (cathepsin A)